MESAYFTTWIAMARLIDEAAVWLAGKTVQEVSEALAKGTAPALIRFITQVAARFEVVVSEKLLAQAIAVIGAATGAAINAAFSDHFNAVARYHFGLRALERKYGEKQVRALYESVRSKASLEKSRGKPPSG